MLLITWIALNERKLTNYLTMRCNDGVLDRDADPTLACDFDTNYSSAIHAAQQHLSTQQLLESYQQKVEVNTHSHKMQWFAVMLFKSISHGLAAMLPCSYDVLCCRIIA